MGCGCENIKIMSDYERISELAKKAAVMEGSVYVVFRRNDGTYGMAREGEKFEGIIVEFKHYL